MESDQTISTLVIVDTGQLIGCINPGLIATERMERRVANAIDAGMTREEFMKTASPLGRPGNPQEIGDVVTFLCSDRAGFVTGTSLTIDGGANWAPIVSGTTENLNDVDLVSATHGYAVGDNGTVLRTANAGLAWTPVATPSAGSRVFP